MVSAALVGSRGDERFGGTLPWPPAPCWVGAGAEGGCSHCAEGSPHHLPAPTWELGLVRSEINGANAQVCAMARDSFGGEKKVNHSNIRTTLCFKNLSQETGVCIAPFRTGFRWKMIGITCG